MVDFEMIEKIEEWGFDLRKEYLDKIAGVVINDRNVILER